MNCSRDKIFIKGLKVYAYHGCFEDERRNGQEFSLDLTLSLDMSKAAATDDLDLTVNYGEVSVEALRVFNENAYNLIETAAEEVAEFLLCKYPLTEEVELTVHKPHAPIPCEFEDVSVTIVRKRHKAYIAVGSNIGDAFETIDKAKEMFCKLKGNRILKEAALITTKPYGPVEQDDFTNGLWLTETLLSPLALLKKLNEIESRLGRKREIHWGPRTIDLDIIYYDDLVMDTERLTIPHVDMANRDFVLKPLLEVDPYVRHPLNELRAEEMLKRLSER